MKQIKKLPKSLNIGFEHCRGDYYTWTSDDNIMKPNAINRMLEVMKKRMQIWSFLGVKQLMQKARK